MCWIFVIKLQIKADTSHSVTVTVFFWSEVICYGILAFWNNMLLTLQARCRAARQYIMARQQQRLRTASISEGAGGRQEARGNLTITHHAPALDIIQRKDK